MTADEQIDAIVRMMVQGEWRGSASRRELAEAWGCHPRTVGERAYAASAVIHRAGSPLEDWIREKLAELDEVKNVAMGLKKAVVTKHGDSSEVEWVEAPDCKAAAMAIKLQLEARGAFNHVKRTQEVPAEPLPDEELEVKLEEALAAVKARRRESMNGKGGGVH
jgi:hypothetical protein